MKLKRATSDKLPSALVDTLMSVNETDSNGETANVVDGLFAIARAIDRFAKVIESRGGAAASHPSGVGCRVEALDVDAHGKRGGGAAA